MTIVAAHMITPLCMQPLLVAFTIDPALAQVSYPTDYIVVKGMPEDGDENNCFIYISPIPSKEPLIKATEMIYKMLALHMLYRPMKQNMPAHHEKYTAFHFSRVQILSTPSHILVHMGYRPRSLSLFRPEEGRKIPTSRHLPRPVIQDQLVVG